MERDRRELERDLRPVLLGLQAPAGVGVAPELAVNPRARDRHLDRRRERVRLVERLARRLEPPGGGEREPHRRQQFGAHRRLVPEQPQRGLVPARGRGGRGPGHRRGGIAQQRGRGGITRPPAALHVVGLRREPGAPRGERRGGSLVRVEPAGGRDRVVHAVAQEQVPEPEQAPVAGRPDEVPRAQLVERRGVRRDAGRGRRELGIERITGHRGTGEKRGGDGSERPGLAPHHVEQTVRAGVASGGPRELAQVQRVASRRGHDRVVLARVASGRDQRE